MRATENGVLEPPVRIDAGDRGRVAFRPTSHRSRGEALQILVVLPNWVGDAVMATPLLRALKQLDPGGTVTVVGKYVTCGVLEGLSSVDRAVVYYPGRYHRLQRVSTVWALRRERFDAVLLLPNSLASLAAGLASRARRQIGYGSLLRRRLLSDPLDRPSGDDGRSPSTIESYLHLGTALGAAAEDRRMELVVRAEDAELTDRFFQSIGLRPHDRPVVINIGGAFGAAKRWPVEYAAKLARRLAEERGYPVVIHCGPGDREDAGAVVRQARSAGVRSMADFDPLPLGLSRGVLSRAAVVLSTDSGPRHMAVALRVPTVSLFGPTGPLANRTHAEHESAIWEPLACAPCWKRDCPLGHHQCMKSLTVNRVLHAITNILDESGRRSA